MRIFLLFVIGFIVACSPESEIAQMVCYSENEVNTFEKGENVRNLQVSPEEVSIFESGNTIHIFRHDEIDMIWARHLPNKVYEISFELSDKQNSLVIIGRTDESCLMTLNSVNSLPKASIF